LLLVGFGVITGLVDGDDVVLLLVGARVTGAVPFSKVGLLVVGTLVGVGVAKGLVVGVVPLLVGAKVTGAVLFTDVFRSLNQAGYQALF
jgi:Na+/citrate or Na+/malate symporter